MKDFLSGKADVVMYEEPTLRHEMMKHGKNADMQVVSGPSPITLSPAVAADRHHSFQHIFEQASIRFFSGENMVTTQERYFPTGVILEESSLAQGGLAEFIGTIIVPIALLTIFLTFYIIARYYIYILQDI